MGTKYATHKELESYKEVVAYAENVKADPGLIANIQDRKEFTKRESAAREQLSQRQAPAPSSDEERAQLRGRQSDLEAFLKCSCEQIGKPAMPSKHEMWETPAGAIGKETKWQHDVKHYTLDANGNPVKAKDGYGAIFEWKDNQRKLRGEEEEFDPDIANVETLRPQNADKSSFADYRRIVTAGSPTFKAHYDEAFPDHAPTPVEAKIAEAKAEKSHCMCTKKNGEPCGSTPLPGTQYCRWHQPKEQVAV